MDNTYSDTVLTPMRVARTTGYIDWSSQPSLFKQYPHFLFRYAYGSNEALKRVELARFISSRSTVGSKPYYRMNVPSAGNLHPTELYVQIRGVKGVLSGIYHVDALHEELVLVREIEGDGLEPALGLGKKFNGMIFVVSCVPYRSEWKYGDRAVRYCYMDAGHQVGGLCTSAIADGHTPTILSQFDRASFDSQMGFGDEEYSTAVIAFGKESEKGVEAMCSALMRVAPTDYCDTSGVIPAQLAGEAIFSAADAPTLFTVDEDVIRKRRSARNFAPETLPTPHFEHFMHSLLQPPNPLSCFAIVLKSETVARGLYRDDRLLKEGDFAEISAALLVDQRFVKDAAVIIVMTAERYGSSALMSAGLFAQQLYLDATSRGVGFTGIGAFYDRKLQRFLETEMPIIYVGALGVERK
jgi:SagB-type dehydrogenase family enzyme